MEGERIRQVGTTRRVRARAHAHHRSADPVLRLLREGLQLALPRVGVGEGGVHEHTEFARARVAHGVGGGAERGARGVVAHVVKRRGGRAAARARGVHGRADGPHVAY
jgi:hypothetical protein